MPIKECTENGVKGYKWGDEGHCYTGEGAKEKALAQGRAIEANKMAKSFMEKFKDFFMNEESEVEVESFHVPEGDGIEEELTKTAVIKSVDADRGLVYGVVYEPVLYDAHDHWTSEEEIEKAAHDYLPNAMLNIQHLASNDLTQADAVVVESFIAPVDFKYDGSDEIIRKGSWVLVTQVYNEELKKALSNGVITGYSLEGTAFLVEENQNS